MSTLNINGDTVSIPAHWADSNLLELLRDYLGLTGAKFGCGIGLCGACTVHLDGQAVRSCVLPVSALRESQITTIEGLANGGKLHPVQQAWIDNAVPQCGYCQPGQIMSASALINANQNPSESDIQNAMYGNICRCGTYTRIRAAIADAAIIAREGQS